MDYQLSGRQITCNLLKDFSNCTDVKDNVSGCFCTNNDHVLEGGMCIHPSTCPGESTILVAIYKYLFSPTYKYRFVTFNII